MKEKSIVVTGENNKMVPKTKEKTVKLLNNVFGAWNYKSYWNWFQ